MRSENTHQLQQACCPLPPPGAAVTSAPRCSPISAGTGRLSRVEVAWSRAKPSALAESRSQVSAPCISPGAMRVQQLLRILLKAFWGPGRAAVSLATGAAATSPVVTQTQLAPSQLQSQKEPSIYFCF